MQNRSVQKLAFSYPVHERGKHFAVTYHKHGKVCWAKLLWFLRFLRVLRKFSHEYLTIVK